MLMVANDTPRKYSVQVWAKAEGSEIPEKQHAGGCTSGRKKMLCQGPQKGAAGFGFRYTAELRRGEVLTQDQAV